MPYNQNQLDLNEIKSFNYLAIPIPTVYPIFLKISQPENMNNLVYFRINEARSM